MIQALMALVCAVEPCAFSLPLEQIGAAAAGEDDELAGLVGLLLVPAGLVLVLVPPLLELDEHAAANNATAMSPATAPVR